MKPLLALCLLLFVIPLQAGNVTLAWDPNFEPELVGYRLAHGGSSGNYTTLIDVGNVTQYTVSDLPAGTYYFAVKAYGEGSLESGWSNEVSATVGNKCDLNMDGNVNVIDLQRMANMSIGRVAPNFGNDLNGDSQINVLDLQILVNVILGKRTCP